MDTTPNKHNGGGTFQPMSSLKDTNRIAREKLIKEMSGIISEAENWLKDAGTLGGEDILAVKDKFEATLKTTKMDLMKLDADLIAKTKMAAQAGATYVKQNPWTVIALGAGTGVALGWLIGRK
ncbi:MAG: ElaB/YqjD/DUF883 family membrane-anchored ribosome-binding protein [Janthinobacterium sp.]|jgi:ElaB/YqjD/DUF883 family membrane-anchored ribosome-binding protein